VASWQQVDAEAPELTARSGSDQPSGPYHLFRCDVTELGVTSVAGDKLVIESWHEGRGVERRERT
jgi:hypothetical protein